MKGIKFGFLSHVDLNLYLFRTPIMTELLKRKHEVYAICPEGDKNEPLKNMGFKVINYKISRRSVNPLLETRAMYNIYKAIKGLNLDVLHTFTAKPNIYGTIAGKMAGIPIIINLVEGLGSFYASDSFKNLLVRNILETLYKYTFSQSHITIFVNQDDAEYMISKNIIHPSKVKVIKGVGIDTNYFSMEHYTQDSLKWIKRKLGLDENKVVVIMVARALRDKGIEEYYKAAEMLSNRHNNVEFLFVGDVDSGNPSSVTRDFLQSSGCVKWLGFRNDIRDITAICDTYVLPSYREGLPRTLLEAASMGKPIVTTNTTGCREVVEDGKNGFLVPVKDYITLAEKIEILINNRKLRLEMGGRGRKKAVEEFHVGKVVEKYMEVYGKLIEERLGNDKTL